jgi:GDP-L-fucose synthase
MKKYSVVVLGSSGLVGSSLKRRLENSNKVSTVYSSTRKDTDLFSLDETKKLLEKTKPDILINAAAKVGGILANNTFRTAFIIDNLKINTNILEACMSHSSIKIINLGSSCIYPLNAKNPIKEDYIMTGKLEPTNSPYAMAKLAAIEIADSLSKEFGHEIYNLMPTNLYGPCDNFSNEGSHVIPGLIHRMHLSKIKKQKEFKIWGTGKPLREFLYVDDFADAVEFLMDKKPVHSLLNVGSGAEVSISDLSRMIKKIIGYKGELKFDHSKPDGNPRKLIDSSKLNTLGWMATTELEEGLSKTYSWYLKNN